VFFFFFFAFLKKYFYCWIENILKFINIKIKYC